MSHICHGKEAAHFGYQFYVFKSSGLIGKLKDSLEKGNTYIGTFRVRVRSFSKVSDSFLRKMFKEEDNSDTDGLHFFASTIKIDSTLS